MTTAQHTPGPWTVCPAAKGFDIRHDIAPGSIRGRLVANVDGRANARLIAVAPELLEALRKLVAYLEPIPFATSCIEGDRAMQGARAAITKAEGRAS